jgi:hypothetical protein
VERISQIFKRPIALSPEDLGAALFELTAEGLQDLVVLVNKQPEALGGIERETFFAEAIALGMFAVRHVLDAQMAEAGLRERTLAAFRARYGAYRDQFHGRTLTAEEADQRAAAYADVMEVPGAAIGAQFVKLCAHPTPMGATTATALYHGQVRAVEKILSHAKVTA